MTLANCPEACGSYGTNFRMAMTSSNESDPCAAKDFEGDGQMYEILYENIQYTDANVGGRGLTGSVDSLKSHVRPGARQVQGSVVLEVGPRQIGDFANAMLGNGDSPSTTKAEVDVVPFDILMDREGGAYVYRHCAVSSWILRGQPATARDPDAQIITLQLNFVGIEEESSSWPVSSPSASAADDPYWLFGDATYSMGSEYPLLNFALMGDLGIRAQYRNFLKPSCLRSFGRSFRFVGDIPYTSTSDAAAYASQYEGTVSLQFDGSKNLTGGFGEGSDTTFTLNNCVQTRKTPNARGKGEIPHKIDLMAYRVSGGSEPLTISNTIDS